MLDWPASASGDPWTGLGGYKACLVTRGGGLRSSRIGPWTSSSFPFPVPQYSYL